MHYLFRPLKHLGPILAWAGERGADMQIAPETFEMSLRLGDRHIVLIPRFVLEHEGRTIYQRALASDGNFIGWMPYPVKSWPLSTRKSANRFSSASVIPTSYAPNAPKRTGSL